MASVYDAVINSYEAENPLVAEWTIAEFQGQEDLRKKRDQTLCCASGQQY